MSGRPRSERARRAILAAADELLLHHGLDAVTMDEIAEHAGASKATIYRWWSSKHLLALEALTIAWGDTVGPSVDTGTLRGDLKALARPWVKRLVEWPYGRIVSELIAEAHRDPEFATVWREHFVFERRRRGREAGERAVARGEIPAGTDVELLLDLVFGSLYHRLLHGHAPLTPDVAARVVDAALDGAVESVRSA